MKTRQGGKGWRSREYLVTKFWRYLASCLGGDLVTMMLCGMTLDLILTTKVGGNLHALELLTKFGP